MVNTMLLVTILSAVLVACQAWVLQTSVDEITPGSTTDVKLTCKVDNSTTSIFEPQSLSRIRITKFDLLGTKTTFAEYRIDSNTTSKVDDDVVVVSSTGIGVDHFLQVTWALASKKTAGVYGCEVSGFDSNQNFVSIETSAIAIKEKQLSTNDVRKLIDLATADYSDRFKKLKLENSNLKTFITGELQTLKQEFQTREDHLVSEISKWKKYADTKYVTGDELAVSVSELKNFTFNEIMTDNVIDENRHTQIDSKIHETAEACKTNYSQLESANELLKSKFEYELQTINQTHHTFQGRVDFRLAKLRNQITAIDTKFQNATNSLGNELSRLATECCVPTTLSTKEPDLIMTTQRTTPTDQDPVVSTVTTTRKPTTTTTQSDVIDWPGGSYTLPKPKSGCPDPERSTVNGRSLFTVLSYSIYQTSSQTGSWNDHLFNIHGHGESYNNAKLCWNKGSDPSNSKRLWPQGSYCIGEYKEACPSSFTAGYISFTSHNSHDKITPILLQFCCRSDGQVDMPINLPSEKHFFLYRLGGSCQQIDGMTINSHDKNELETKGLDASSYSTTHPDMSSNRHRIVLCHYKPKN